MTWEMLQNHVHLCVNNISFLITEKPRVKKELTAKFKTSSMHMIKWNCSSKKDTHIPCCILLSLLWLFSSYFSLTHNFLKHIKIKKNFQRKSPVCKYQAHRTTCSLLRSHLLISNFPSSQLLLEMNKNNYYKMPLNIKGVFPLLSL